MEHQHKAALRSAAEIHMEQAAHADAQDPESIDDVMERIGKLTMRDIMEPINNRRRKEYTAKCTDEAAHILRARGDHRRPQQSIFRIGSTALPSLAGVYGERSMRCAGVQART